MIVKSPAKDDSCAICERKVPDNALLLRKLETKKAICIPCLVEIAELTIQQPVQVTKDDANRIKPDIDKQ